MGMFEGRSKVIFAMILVAILALLKDDVVVKPSARPVVAGKKPHVKRPVEPRPASKAPGQVSRVISSGAA